MINLIFKSILVVLMPITLLSCGDTNNYLEQKKVPLNNDTFKLPQNDTSAVLSDNETTQLSFNYHKVLSGYVGKRKANLFMTKPGLNDYITGFIYFADEQRPYFLSSNLKMYYIDDDSLLYDKGPIISYKTILEKTDEETAFKEDFKTEVLILQKIDSSQNAGNFPGRNYGFRGKLINDSIYRGFYFGDKTKPIAFELIEKKSNVIYKDLKISKFYKKSNSQFMEVKTKKESDNYIDFNLVLPEYYNNQELNNFIKKSVFEAIAPSDVVSSDFSLNNINQFSKNYFATSPSNQENFLLIDRIKRISICYNTDSLLGFMIRDRLDNSLNKQYNRYLVYSYDLKNMKKFIFSNVFKLNSKEEILNIIKNNFDSSKLSNFENFDSDNFLITNKGIYFVYDTFLDWSKFSALSYPQEIFLPFDKLKNVLNPEFKIPN